jgi:hypothetical protein
MFEAYVYINAAAIFCFYYAAPLYHTLKKYFEIFRIKMTSSSRYVLVAPNEITLTSQENTACAYNLPPLMSVHGSFSNNLLADTNQGTFFKDKIIGILFMSNLTLAITCPYSPLQHQSFIMLFSAHLWVLTVSLLATAFLGYFWISFLNKYSECLFRSFMMFTIVICSSISIVCAYSTYFVASIVFLLLAIFNYWSFRSIHAQIPLASAVLSIACKAIKNNYLCLSLSSIVTIKLQLWWILLSYNSTKFFVFLYTDSFNNNQPSTGSTFIIFLNHFWGRQIIKQF